MVFLFSGLPLEVPGVAFFTFGVLFSKNLAPSILNDSTAFWLYFRGPGSPGNRTIEKKRLMEISCFSSFEKAGPGSIFSDFGVHLGVSFGAPGRTKDER